VRGIKGALLGVLQGKQSVLSATIHTITFTADTPPCTPVTKTDLVSLTVDLLNGKFVGTGTGSTVS